MLGGAVDWAEPGSDAEWGVVLSFGACSQFRAGELTNENENEERTMLGGGSCAGAGEGGSDLVAERGVGGPIEAEQGFLQDGTRRFP